MSEDETTYMDVKKCNHKWIWFMSDLVETWKEKVVTSEGKCVDL